MSIHSKVSTNKSITILFPLRSLKISIHSFKKKTFHSNFLFNFQCPHKFPIHFSFNSMLLLCLFRFPFCTLHSTRIDIVMQIPQQRPFMDMKCASFCRLKFFIFFNKWGGKKDIDWLQGYWTENERFWMEFLNGQNNFTWKKRGLIWERARAKSRASKFSSLSTILHPLNYRAQNWINSSKKASLKSLIVTDFPANESTKSFNFYLIPFLSSLPHLYTKVKKKSTVKRNPQTYRKCRWWKTHRKWEELSSVLERMWRALESVFSPCILYYQYYITSTHFKLQSLDSLLSLL